MSIFLTWSTFLPLILALFLSGIHMAACRLVWPTATITLSTLTHLWVALIVTGLIGIVMLGVDLYGTFWVADFDHQLMQKYFDQAEYWLQPWTAPVVRVFTLGYINPRQMVTVEVRKALEEASRLLNSTMWWVTAQVGLRVAFGLALWLTYALSNVNQV
jgi:hypothetical protein